MKVRELLSDESKWCKGPLAVDKEGRQTTPKSPTACKWCLWGAILRCYADDPLVPSDNAYCAAKHKIIDIIQEIHGSSRRGRGRGIAVFNEASETTFAEIREVLERADV
jgi:hypothetical protein